MSVMSSASTTLPVIAIEAAVLKVTLVQYSQQREGDG